MAPKPTSRSWYDIQMTIAAISMSLMLMLWNLFAGPDRAKAEAKKQEAQVTPPPPTEAPVLALTPTPITKIYFSTSQQPQASVPQLPTNNTKKNRNGGGGKGSRGGGGGSTGTS